MSLEWKMDLWLCLGYPILIGLIHHSSKARPYISEIDLFGYHDIAPYFFILFCVLFLAPWTSIFITPNMREKLQTQEWVFTIPIESNTIFQRGWMRTMIMFIIVVGIPFLKISSEKDANIKLYMNSDDHPELRLAQVQMFFPESELRTIQKEDENRSWPTIIIKNGKLYCRLLALTAEMWIYFMYLNLMFWMIQKASRLKLLKWIYFGMLGLIILTPITRIFTKWNFNFGNPYHILFLFVKYLIPIALVTLIFIILTYFRGQKSFPFREIE